jgi:hypothetical protein
VLSQNIALQAALGGPATPPADPTDEMPSGPLEVLPTE